MSSKFNPKLSMNKPPYSIPKKIEGQTKTKSVHASDIKRCLFKYIYIWPKKGRSYWAWLTYVGKKYVSGFRWNGHHWIYFRIELKKIDNFVCI